MPFLAYWRIAAAGRFSGLVRVREESAITDFGSVPSSSSTSLLLMTLKNTKKAGHDWADSVQLPTAN